jgi:hypothetical protein
MEIGPCCFGMICEAMMRRVGAGVSVGWVTPESGTAAMWPEIGVIPESSPNRKLYISKHITRIYDRVRVTWM